MAITNDTVTLDDTLRAELDALGVTYWRWATRDDALAYLANDLSSALDNVLYRLAPEGTDGQAFSSWVRDAFHNNGGERSMTACMTMALESTWRGRWDVTYVLCDYCAERATRVTYSGESLCADHARRHYGVDWRRDTKVLGERALEQLNG